MFIDYLSQITQLEMSIIEITIIIAIIIIIDRIIVRKTKAIAERLHVSVQALRSFITLLRFILLAILLIALATVEILPTEYFVGAGALIGTAIGFGMSRYISNFVSGAYILFSGLYKIGDYVRIGDDEGIVIDMSVNYTKIKRDDGTILVLSNQSILNLSVVNYRKKGLDVFIYPIEVSFDLNHPWEKIKSVLDEVISSIKKDVNEAYFEVNKITRLDATVSIIITVEKPEKIPELKAKVLAKIMEELSTKN